MIEQNQYTDYSLYGRRVTQDRKRIQRKDYFGIGIDEKGNEESIYN